MADKMEKGIILGANRERQNGFEIQFSFLYSPYLMAAEMLINCQIKCKFICGNCKRTHREKLEKCIQESAKKGSQNRFKWGSEIKNDLSGQNEACQIVKENGI